jgi:hypothetical protein
MNLQITDATPWTADGTRIIRVSYLFGGVSYFSKIREVNDGKHTKRVCPCCGAHVAPADIRPTRRGLACGFCEARQS